MMPEELKPCPFCGSMNVVISPYGGAKAIACMDCFCRSEIFGGENAKEKAIAAWNRRTAPENKPLTIDELPCFEPIYVVPLGTSVGEWSAHWCIYQIDNATAESDTHKGRIWFLYDTDYGKTWLAYPHKSEAGETK